MRSHKIECFTGYQYSIIETWYESMRESGIIDGCYEGGGGLRDYFCEWSGHYGLREREVGGPGCGVHETCWESGTVESTGCVGHYFGEVLGGGGNRVIPDPIVAAVAWR